MFSIIGIRNVGVHDIDVAHSPERGLLLGLKMPDDTPIPPEEHLVAGVAEPSNGRQDLVDDLD